MNFRKIIGILLLMGLCYVLTTSSSWAGYIFTDTVSTGSGHRTIGFVSGKESERNIQWTHSLGGVPECPGTDQTALSITLKITADDVDMVTDYYGKIFGEFDAVYMSQDEQNWSLLGDLTQDGFSSLTEGYILGPGHPNDPNFLSTSLFDLTQFNLDLNQPLYMKVTAQHGADLEIESSVLTVRCTPVPIPGAIWLLGSGLVCIVGVSRQIHRRKLAAKS